MKHIPDKFFQLAITDPPYGIGIDGQKLSINKNPKHNRKQHTKKDWDSAGIPGADYFRELERISENQIIWGGNYFVEHLQQGHKGWIVWDKGQHGLTMSLSNYAAAGDRIIDTHAGSGASCVACHNLRLDWMAFEIDPEYYTKADERIRAAQAQMSIFDFMT